MRLHNTLSALLILSFLTLPAEAQNLLSTQQWRQDLHYLADQIVRVHPAAFHNLSEQDFNSAVADLDRRIPALSDQKLEVELIRLVASLGEGHSRVSPPGLPDPMSDVAQVTRFKDPRLAFHRLPLQLYRFSDGLYVIYQRKTDPLWAGESTEQAMQHIGSQLVSRKSYRDALIVFTINHMDYPGSIGSALQTVKTAEASNPHDPASMTWPGHCDSCSVSSRSEVSAARGRQAAGAAMCQGNRRARRGQWSEAA